MENTTNQEKLLEGLTGAGISVSVGSLAKYIASNGVLVRPYVGRSRCYIPMPAAAYGLDLTELSEGGSAFYKERVSQGRLSLIPKEDEDQLGAIEKRLRRAVQTRTLTDLFMPVSEYETLKDEFESLRTDYYDKRDDIVAKWPRLVADFEDGAREMLDGIRMPQELRKKLLDDFMAQVPSGDEYRASFDINLKVTAFPATNEVEGLADSIAADVTDTWKESVVSTAILSIEKMVGEGWSKMTKAMTAYTRTRTIPTVTINSMSKFGKDVERKNVFRNPLLNEMGKSLKKLSELTVEDAAQVIEDAVVQTYGYAKEARLNLDWTNSPYTKAQLEAMFQLMESEA